MLRYAACVSTLALAFAASAAHAQGQGAKCELTIDAAPSVWAINGYDPFAGGDPVRLFDLTLRNEGKKPCIGDILVELDGEPFGLLGSSGERIGYHLTDNQDGRNLTPYTGGIAGTQQGKPVHVEPSESLIQRFAFSPDVAALPGDGLFSQPVNFVFLERNDTNRAERQVTLSLQVNPAALMGLKGAYTRVEGVPRLDLQELETGAKTLPVELYVLSTRGYEVSITSENQGRLVHTQDGGWSVPYSLAFGDNVMNLTGGDSFSQLGSVLRQDSYPITVVVGEVAGRRAGTYSDLVTLTVAPI